MLSGFEGCPEFIYEFGFHNVRILESSTELMMSGIKALDRI